MTPEETLMRARLAAKITQRELAATMGISPQYLNDIEHEFRSFTEKYLDNLPQGIARDVAAAMIEVHQAAITRLLMFIPDRKQP